jgi:hypothetical protein
MSPDDPCPDCGSSLRFSPVAVRKDGSIGWLICPNPKCGWSEKRDLTDKIRERLANNPHSYD